MTPPLLIEPVPLSTPVEAEITVPGSKSITNRALLLAAQSSGRTTLEGALWSEDTEIMVNCLQSLGVAIDVMADSREAGNRTIVVTGASGLLTPGGPRERPLELFVGNSGTAARFIAALTCLGDGYYRLSGTPRMNERPQSALFTALQELGYTVESTNGRLPVTIRGNGPRPGAECRVRLDESSQFASALMLVSASGGWHVALEGENANSAPYVQLTADVLRGFPVRGGTFQVEPDASSASYFWGAGWLLSKNTATSSSRVRVAGWMDHSSQIDWRFPAMLQAFPARISRESDLGDSIMTAIVLAPFADEPKTFVDLGRLRLQECERVQALHNEMKKCGALIVEEGDSLHVTPGPLHGAEIETYGDHRMAMCFATLGLVVPGIRVRNPEVVKKTFPNFFEKLSRKPPHGLGVRVRSEPS